jgi:hypothetical protein
MGSGGLGATAKLITQLIPNKALPAMGVNFGPRNHRQCRTGELTLILVKECASPSERFPRTHLNIGESQTGVHFGSRRNVVDLCPVFQAEGGLARSGTEARTAAMLSKVPAITLSFWIIKIMSTTVGETGADYLAVHVGSARC